MRKKNRTNKPRTKTNKGVYKCTIPGSIKSYRAVLSYFANNMKSKTIGYYSTFNEAVEAYRNAFKEQMGYECQGLYINPETGKEV